MMGIGKLEEFQNYFYNIAENTYMNASERSNFDQYPSILIGYWTTEKIIYGSNPLSLLTHNTWVSREIYEDYYF